MRRTTHGLLTIKTTLEEMNIPYEIVPDEKTKILEFKLLIKTYDNEDSNI